MKGNFIFALLALSVNLASAAPNGIQNLHFHITNLGGGILTAYPEEPPLQPGHTYPIPGKVFVEEFKGGALEQQWIIETSEATGITRFRSGSNNDNELEIWMPYPDNYPTGNSWKLIEDVSQAGTFYIQNTFNNYCINHDGLNKRIRYGLCSSTGTESKWTFELANGD